MRKALSRPNRTLHYPHRPVHGVRTVLKQPVKVQAGGLVTELVVDVDGESLADVGMQGGRGPSAVDADDGTGVQSVWVAVDPADVPSIGSGVDREEVAEGEEDVDEGGHCGTKEIR